MSEKGLKLEIVYVKSLGAVFVYSQSYNKSVETVSKFVEALKSSYPEVDDSEINIDIFGGAKLDKHIYIRAKVDRIVDGAYVVEDENFFY